LFGLDFYEPLPIQVEVSDAPLTSDAGLLPVRQFDERIGLTRQFADVLDDPRDPDLTEHTFLEMVRSRVYGILAGNEDQNDHDTLRTDPVFKLVADRSPEDEDLASQPTLSRFENALSIQSLKRLRDVFVDQFTVHFLLACRPWPKPSPHPCGESFLRHDSGVGLQGGFLPKDRVQGRLLSRRVEMAIPFSHLLGGMANPLINEPLVNGLTHTGRNEAMA
jgi:hypothetical protein